MTAPHSDRFGCTQRGTLCDCCYKSFPVERRVDTHRHWCGTSSGRLIRNSVDNTGAAAYGFWLASSHPLAAERSPRQARGIQYVDV